MSKKNIYILIAFLVLLSVISTFFITHFRSADAVAVYTRNALSWTGAKALEDGAVHFHARKGKNTVQLRNQVAGNIGYYLYLYGKTADRVQLSAKDGTAIPKEEYPLSLEGYNVKGAYRGYLAGGGKRNFTIRADEETDLMLLLIMEDNNSYPKEEESLPVVANIKFSAEVLLDGQYPRGNRFSFALTDAEGTVLETVRNEDGYIAFSNIALREKGSYIYYISQTQGKDDKISYDQSVYKINVIAEGKNDVRISYEKDGTRVETLPRFSNYKERTELVRTENVVEYPTNEKKDDTQANVLLIIAVGVALLLIIFYIVSGRRKG